MENFTQLGRLGCWKLFIERMKTELPEMADRLLHGFHKTLSANQELQKNTEIRLSTDSVQHIAL